jgi:FixJ family two-component response regulator
VPGGGDGDPEPRVMTNSSPPKVLVVDDEEAILETMFFTFMDEYEVITTTSARKALKLLDEHAPVAVIITDQRMPEINGVELLAQVVESHPNTVRIMLTGFADAEATIQAINDGHIYAYINKPWEPEELKQVVRRAVEHHELTRENLRLVAELISANHFLGAVMDRLDTGAVATDADGIVRASNQPARAYLKLDDDPRGVPLAEILGCERLQAVEAAVLRLAHEQDGSFEDVELGPGSKRYRLRVSAQRLTDGDGVHLGSVILFKEVSHEPLRRRFEEIVADVVSFEGELRSRLERALEEFGELGGRVLELGIASPSMTEVSERCSRTQTAIQNWLDVDELMVSEDYPDAQLLIDRMRLARERWPLDDELPQSVEALTARVEAYYDSGENPKQRVL